MNETRSSPSVAVVEDDQAVAAYLAGTRRQIGRWKRLTKGLTRRGSIGTARV